MASYEVYKDWERHDGKLVTVNGLRCKLRVRTYDDCPVAVITVSAEPTAHAKQSEVYRAVRADLGDDWSTDVLESDVTVQSAILAQLGE